MTTNVSSKNETRDVALHGTEIAFYCSVNNENKWKEGANIFTSCKKQILGHFIMININQSKN